MEWSNTSADEFYSAAADGTVRLWDIKKCKARSDSKKKSQSSSQTKKRDARYSMPAGATGSALAHSPQSLKRASTMGVIGNGLGSGNSLGLAQASAYELAKRTEDWLPSQSWRLYRQRLARENSLPSYNYFLDNQNPDSPCTTVFNANKQFLSLALVQMPLHNGYNAKSVGQLVSIDSDGFFGVHSKVKSTGDGTRNSDSNAVTTAAFNANKQMTGKGKEDKRISISSFDSCSSKSDLDERLDHDLNESPRGSHRSSSSSHSSRRRGSASSGEQKKAKQELPPALPAQSSSRRRNTVSFMPAPDSHYNSVLHSGRDTSRKYSAGNNTDRFSAQIQPLNFFQKPTFDDEYMMRKLENLAF